MNSKKVITELVALLSKMNNNKAIYVLVPLLSALLGGFAINDEQVAVITSVVGM